MHRKNDTNSAQRHMKYDWVGYSEPFLDTRNPYPRNAFKITIDDSPVETLDKRSWVIHPYGIVYKIWLGVVTICVVYNLYLIIGRAVFWELENLSPRVWRIFDCICDAIYLLDIIAHILTGHFEEGLLVTDKTKIFKKYAASGRIVYDILCIMPTDISYTISRDKCSVLPCQVIFRLNRILKFPRMKEFFRIIKLQTNYFFSIGILEITVYILIFIHWNACFYFAISYIIGFGSDPWVYPAINGISATLKHQYIHCIYWSACILVSQDVDEPPSTEVEYLTEVFEIAIGIVIIATIIGKIASAIQDKHKRKEAFHQNVYALKKFFHHQNVDAKLQAKTLKWCDFVFRKKHPKDEHAILEMLHDDMQIQVARSIHKNMLRNVPFLMNTSECILNSLVRKFTLKVFSQGEYVCKKGWVSNEMFVLITGKLAVCESERSEIYENEIRETKCFGDLYLVGGYGQHYGCKHIASVKSEGFSELYSLSKKDLNKVFDEFPEFAMQAQQNAKEKLFRLGLSSELDGT